MTCEEKTNLEDEIFFKFRVAPITGGNEDVVGQEGMELKSGPMAMRMDSEMGWVAEELGPKSGHWKRLARAAHVASPKKEGPKDKILGKRPGPTSVKVLENIDTTRKRNKIQKQSKGSDERDEMVGGKAAAAEQPRRAS